MQFAERCGFMQEGRFADAAAVQVRKAGQTCADLDWTTTAAQQYFTGLALHIATRENDFFKAPGTAALPLSAIHDTN
jgi:hypothetical protein